MGYKWAFSTQINQVSLNRLQLYVRVKYVRKRLFSSAHTLSIYVISVWRPVGASAPLSPQLSTIIIALLLAAKMATGDYDEGERKGHSHNPVSEEEVVVFNMWVCECVLTMCHCSFLSLSESGKQRWFSHQKIWCNPFYYCGSIMTKLL